MKMHWIGATALALGVAIGCSESPPASDEAAPTTTAVDGDPADGTHEHADGHHEDHDHGDMELMQENLAQLSEQDRTSAEQQHMCPVTGEMLGAMGVPEKITVNGQDVWICCPGCKEPLLQEPEKYLSQLGGEE